MRAQLYRAALCLWLGGAGCASGPRAGEPAPVAVPPAQLIAPSTLPYDFQWRQRVTAHWPKGSHSFDAVLLKRADELTLIGLSPLGLPGFVLRLRGTAAIAVENRTGQPLPFEPRYVLADVQRVFFPWLADSAVLDSAERSAQRGDTRIVERYEQGRLRTRSFERETPRGLERVLITYWGQRGAGEAPARATLANALLGYVLTIDTVEQVRLGR